MTYRIQTSTFVVECDHASEVANLVAALFGRDEDETAKIVDRDPAPKVTAKPGPKPTPKPVPVPAKPGPKVRDGGRVATCVRCTSHFKAAAVGILPKYCTECRGKVKEPKKPVTAFKDIVPIGAQA